MTDDTNENNVLHLENSEFDLRLRIDDFEDEGEKIRFIKSVEKMVRRSPEYTLWRNYIMDILGQTTCEITNENSTDCDIEVHHHPIGLYTIVEALVDDFLNKKVPFSTFDVATKCIELHFQNKVGYVVLISNMHQKFHRGKLSLPIEFVRGDWKYIPQHFALNEDSQSRYLELANIHIDQCKEQWSKGNYPGLLETTKSTISVTEDKPKNVIEEKKSVIELDDDIQSMLSVTESNFDGLEV